MSKIFPRKQVKVEGKLVATTDVTSAGAGTSSSAPGPDAQMSERFYIAERALDSVGTISACGDCGEAVKLVTGQTKEPLCPACYAARVSALKLAGGRGFRLGL